MRRRRSTGPIYVVTFGVGLIVAFYCPLKLLVLLLAIAVIYLGFSSCRC